METIGIGGERAGEEMNRIEKEVVTGIRDMKIICPHTESISGCERTAEELLKIWKACMEEVARKMNSEVSEEDKNACNRMEFLVGTELKFIFAPTDLELVKCYLVPKALNIPYPFMRFIPESDVYSKEPWKLHMDNDFVYEYSRKKNARYFFCYRLPYKCDGSRHEPRYTVGEGFWECYRHNVKIMDNDYCFGWKNYHVFKRTEDEKETGWIMEEYVLNPRIPGNERWMVCKIYCPKKGKGSR